MNTQKAAFIRSAASAGDFIRDGRPGVVFAGRSNVGKSSLINSLLNRKNFARVGSTPGKTAHVNYFLVDGTYFVDLPGYGFAQVPDRERRRWGELMEAFFARPEDIALGILIVDCRHRPTGDDVTMARYFQTAGRPFVVVANKSDKLRARERDPAAACVRETLGLAPETPLLLYSCVRGEGRQELLERIESHISLL